MSKCLTHEVRYTDFMSIGLCKYSEADLHQHPPTLFIGYVDILWL